MHSKNKLKSKSKSFLKLKEFENDLPNYRNLNEEIDKVQNSIEKDTGIIKQGDLSSYNYNEHPIEDYEKALGIDQVEADQFISQIDKNYA